MWSALIPSFIGGMKRIDGATTPPKLMFTQEDSDLAYREWNATCGPHALAAALGFTLEQVKRIMPAFKGRGTTGEMVERALTLAGKECWLKHGLRTKKLCDGINNIVWPKRWLAKGIPQGTAGEYHLIAHFGGFVYCTALPPSLRAMHGGWVPVAVMDTFYQKEYGDWHVTDWVYGIQ